MMGSDLFQAIARFVGQFARRGLGGADLVDVAPLRDEVVLHARDRQAVEELLARERLDVRDVLGREARRQFDDHAPGRAAPDTACFPDPAGASRMAVPTP